MEYIERNTVLSKAFKTGLCDENGHVYGVEHVILLNDVLALPTHRVQPLNFAFWQLRPDGKFHCSSCRKTLDSSSLTPFCAHCGASMVGKEE